MEHRANHSMTTGEFGGLASFCRLTPVGHPVERHKRPTPLREKTLRNVSIPRVLVVGASGGVGTFAVQIAKSLGAEVTGVCSTRNMDMVRSIGADHVIDYTGEDFTQSGQRYDFILDNVGSHSLSDTRRALTPEGTLSANGAPVSGWFGGLGYFFKAFVMSLFVSQQERPFLSMPNEDDLATLKELAEAGQVTPVIDRTYPLDETPEAIGHVGEGHSQGKTIITV
jgi:NADPH:quinone reductase-like Zn-dependent oxidoreductase